MKITSILLLCLAVGCALGAQAASDLVGPTRFGNLPVTGVLMVYEHMTGQKLAATDEVKAIKTTVTAYLEKRPKEDVLRFIEATLAQQAGIEIVRKEDGTLIARKMATKN